jgi:hypothetical protein
MLYLSVRYGFMITGLWRESSARPFKLLDARHHRPMNWRILFIIGVPQSSIRSIDSNF